MDAPGILPDSDSTCAAGSGAEMCGSSGRRDPAQVVQQNGSP